MEVPGCQLPETEFFETLKDQLSLWLYVLRDAGIGVVHGNCRRPRSFYWVHGSCQFPESLYPAGHQAIGFPFIRKDRLSSDRGCRGSWLTWRWRCTIREAARIFYWAHGRCQLPEVPWKFRVPRDSIRARDTALHFLRHFSSDCTSTAGRGANGAAVEVALHNSRSSADFIFS